MSQIWSDGEKLRALARRRARRARGLGRVGAVSPPTRWRRSASGATVPTPERVAEIERETNHDVAAFVDAVSEGLGDEGRWFHYGLTSSDVLDTALSLAVQDAGALVLEGLDRAFGAVVVRAEEHRETICMGRTHGVHAEPTTFGLKLAGWAFALDRDRERLVRAIEGLRVGKLSGAVGTYAAAEPEVERVACERLGLEPAPSSTQILQRDRHAELLSALALARLVARPLRDRDPPPRAHRGARGRGAVRPRPEGLVGDAAQAQPDHRRAHLRARARGARRTRSSGSRTSPSGTSATSRTPRPSASSCPTRSSPSTTCSTGSPGSSRGSSSARSGCATNLDVEPRALLQPAAAARARRVRALARRRLPARAAKRHAGLGRGHRLPRARRRRCRDRAAASTSTRVFDPGAYTAHVDVVFERLRALVSTRREGARV